MSTVRLSSTSYLVLGLIGLRGPSTPYELKGAVDRSGIGEFWPFPHSQLYDEPARLADAGLLEEEREETGRRRRVYRLTDEGRTAIGRWVRQPEAGGFQIRDEASLKVFFSELGADDHDLVGQARLQLAFHRERLARYQAMEARYADRPERARRLAPLRFGLHLTRAAIEFWSAVADERPASETGAPTDTSASPAPTGRSRRRRP